MPPTASPTAKSAAIIVGSGLAGLSAASELVGRGVAVRMLERAAKPGGNSIKASSGINAAPTRFQPTTIHPDSAAAFYEDTVKSAGSLFTTTAREQRQKLVSTLTHSSATAVDWLVDEKGIDLSLVTQLGGHGFPRTHRGGGKNPPPGAAIVFTLLGKLKESPLFSLETNSQVTKVLVSSSSGDSRSVTGVEYITTPAYTEHDSSSSSNAADQDAKELHGPVVFASGGFGGDATGLLAQYRPDLTGYPSTNEPRPGSQPLLTAVGAGLLDMDQVQVHPTGFVDPKTPESPLKFLAAELLRGEGGILLRPEDGVRFVNEMETRLNVTNAITQKASVAEGEVPRQWNVQLVLDEGAFEAARSHIEFYLWKGLMQKTTVSELGPAALITIQEYANVVAGEAKDAFGRTSFGQWKLREATPESVVYIGRVTPVVHFTMGGVTINEHAEVMDGERKVIKGLWAAGEVTGGIHGENRLGGSSLLECVVFGRIAGEQVTRYLEEK